jgi:hypothetical protein
MLCNTMSETRAAGGLNVALAWGPSCGELSIRHLASVQR